jgi:phytoene dehydrogenase-like protein
MQIVRARKAVVSNASMWDTLDLLPPDAVPRSYQDKVKATPQCESFMHLHLGFDVEVGCHTLIFIKMCVFTLTQAISHGNYLRNWNRMPERTLESIILWLMIGTKELMLTRTLY